MVLTDIGELSDAELRQQLSDYGVKAGPIVATTRLFYEKKLAKLIDSGGAPPPQPETESEEEEDEEEEEEEEVVQTISHKPEPKLYSRPAPAPAPVQTPTQQRTQVPTGYTPVIQQRRASPSRATQRNVASAKPAPRQTDSAPDKKTTKKLGGGMALWIKLLFVVIVAVLLYLVIINVNPSAQNKIPLTLDENV